MHLPELALRLRGESGFSAEFRIGMEVQRELFENQANILWVSAQDRFASEMAFWQKGHWKSENSTMVTFALSGPLLGSPASEICTGSSKVGGGSEAAFFTSARTWVTVLPAAKLFIATDASFRL